jgi:pimeloyl-ACP methyl ester carboxylesterase
MNWRAFAVPVEGALLSGEIRGENPRLVFIHGMGGSRATWDAVIAAPPVDLPMVRYDLRGFGASASDDSIAYSHSADLLTLANALGFERIIPAGLSLGGGVAANFALGHPERTEALILISPALTGWEWSAEWRALWRAVSVAARAGDMTHARALWFDHPMFTAARQAGLGEYLRREIDAFAGRQWVRDPQTPALPDVERLHLLGMPVLLLTGEADVADFRLIGDVLAATAPRIHRIDHPGAGHLLTLERPAQIAAAIAALAG